MQQLQKTQLSVANKSDGNDVVDDNYDFVLRGLFQPLYIYYLI